MADILDLTAPMEHTIRQVLSGMSNQILTEVSLHEAAIPSYISSISRYFFVFLRVDTMSVAPVLPFQRLYLTKVTIGNA